MNKERNIAEWKKEKVSELVNLIDKYETIAIIDLTSMPSPQLQKMRAQLKGKAIIKITRTRLIMRALEQCKRERVKELKNYLVNIPGIIFSDIEPFRLSKILIKSKVSTFAKPGQIAPSDIIVPAGPTPFTPGPVIGELGQLGIKTSMEGGKISIKENTVITKAGQTISEKVASMLSKLGIEPMEIGINLIAAYEKDKIYPKEVLMVDEKSYIEKIKTAYMDALYLSLNKNIVTRENIGLIIQKAYIIANNLAGKIKMEVNRDTNKQERAEETKKEAREERISEIKKDVVEGRVVSDEEFKRDEKIAREILNTLQREKAKALSLPKQKEETIKKVDVNDVL